MLLNIYVVENRCIDRLFYVTIVNP